MTAYLKRIVLVGCLIRDCNHQAERSHAYDAFEAVKVGETGLEALGVALELQVVDVGGFQLLLENALDAAALFLFLAGRAAALLVELALVLLLEVVIFHFIYALVRITDNIYL